MDSPAQQVNRDPEPTSEQVQNDVNSVVETRGLHVDVGLLADMHGTFPSWLPPRLPPRLLSRTQRDVQYLAAVLALLRGRTDLLPTEGAVLVLRAGNPSDLLGPRGR